MQYWESFDQGDSPRSEVPLAHRNATRNVDQDTATPIDYGRVLAPHRARNDCHVPFSSLPRSRRFSRHDHEAIWSDWYKAAVSLEHVGNCSFERGEASPIIRQHDRSVAAIGNTCSFLVSLAVKCFPRMGMYLSNYLKSKTDGCAHNSCHCYGLDLEATRCGLGLRSDYTHNQSCRRVSLTQKVSDTFVFFSNFRFHARP